MPKGREQREREQRAAVLADLISVAEAARLIGVNESSIRKAIKSGRLTARKIGPVHLVSRTEVAGYAVVGHRPRKVRPLTNRSFPA